jgi:hypothetical protein
MQNKANFAKAKMSAKDFSQRDYEEKSGLAGQESKAKQSQF